MPAVQIPKTTTSRRGALPHIARQDRTPTPPKAIVQLDSNNPPTRTRMSEPTKNPKRMRACILNKAIAKENCPAGKKSVSGDVRGPAAL